MEESDEATLGHDRSELGASDVPGAVPTPVARIGSARAWVGSKAGQVRRAVPRDRRDAGRFRTSHRKGAPK